MNKPGDRVKLLHIHSTGETYAVKRGSIGMVDFIDDIGTVHCTWEGGYSLGLVPGKDRWETLPISIDPRSK